MTGRLEPGEYEWTVIWVNTAAPGEGFWRGHVVAGLVLFRARAPQGPRDRGTLLVAQARRSQVAGGEPGGRLDLVCFPKTMTGGFPEKMAA